MSGVVMYPKIMKEKTRTMQKQLEQLEPYTESAYSALGKVETSSLWLSGVAWDSVGAYMREVQQPLMEMYQLWLRSQKDATLIYYKEACRLPDVHFLDEVRLEEEKERYEILLEREYERERPKYSRIRRYRRMIKEIESKLTAMRTFIDATCGIYEKSAELLSMLEKADTRLNGVGMDPVTYAINYTSVDKEWLLKIQKKVSYEYLKMLGISDETIKRMEELGLSCVDLKATYGSLQTEEDKEFFFGILNENYRTTFQIDPVKLSTETEFFLTEYTRLLLNKRKVSELQVLINEILYTDPDHSYYANSSNMQSYAEKYINILFETSSYLLDEEGKMIFSSGGIIKEEVIDAFCQNAEELADLNVLWGAIKSTAFDSDYFYASGIESVSMHLLYGSRIENLVYPDSGFRYDMMYSTAWVKEYSIEAAGNNIGEIEWHEDNFLSVNTSINTELSSINYKEHRETIQRLKTQKDSLWAKYSLNAIIGVTSGFCPEAGAVLGIMAGINEGNATKAGNQSYILLEKSGIVKPEIMEQYKAGGKSAVVAATSLIDYFKEHRGMEAQIANEYTQENIEWFGATSSFTATSSFSEEDRMKTAGFSDGERTEIVNAGYYNAQALKDLKDWEENGLSVVLIKGIKEENKVDKVINNLKYQLNKEGKYTDDVKTLIEGGNVSAMDKDNRRGKAVEAIQEAYNDFYTGKEIGPFGKKLDILSRFQESVKEEQ